MQILSSTVWSMKTAAGKTRNVWFKSGCWMGPSITFTKFSLRRSHDVWVIVWLDGEPSCPSWRTLEVFGLPSYFTSLKNFHFIEPRYVECNSDGYPRTVVTPILRLFLFKYTVHLKENVCSCLYFSERKQHHKLWKIKSSVHI